MASAPYGTYLPNNKAVGGPGTKAETPPNNNKMFAPHIGAMLSTSWNGGFIGLTSGNGNEYLGPSLIVKSSGGSGLVINPDNVCEYHHDNGCVSGTMGPNVQHGNSNETVSYTGECSQISSGSTTHAGSKGGGAATDGGVPGRPCIKQSCDQSSAMVFPSDTAIVAAGKLGIAAQDMTIKGAGNLTLGGGGTGACSSEGDFTVASEQGCLHVTGVGCAIGAMQGPLSIFSQGKMSAYTNGADIIVNASGGRVYINSIAPVPVDQVVAETKHEGAPNLPGMSVAGRSSAIGTQGGKAPIR